MLICCQNAFNLINSGRKNCAQRCEIAFLIMGKICFLEMDFLLLV